MKSFADQLPPEIARQIHPDWRKNEAVYSNERDRLLAQYRGQWIAFADGAVIAAASTPLEVFLAIQHSKQHPYVIRVGHENEPWYRIRRASYPYDSSYPGTALPIVDVEFRAVSGSPGVILDRVIPDTGADTTTLPWPDCQRLRLDPAVGVPGVITGVAGGMAVTAENAVPSLPQSKKAGKGRILARSDRQEQAAALIYPCQGLCRSGQSQVARVPLTRVPWRKSGVRNFHTEQKNGSTGIV